MAVALDTETEIIKTLVTPDACATYYRDGLSSEHFADEKCEKVYSWCMDYYLTHGKMVEAPTLDVIVSEFPEYPELVKDAKGAAPSYLSQRLKGEYTKRQVTDTVSVFLPKLSEDPLSVAVLMREALSGIVDSCATADEILEYGDDMDADTRQLVEDVARRRAVEDALIAAGARISEMARYHEAAADWKDEVESLTSL